VEGLVSIEDPVKAGRLKAIAEAAPWFEERMPFDPAFRKPDVTGVSARSIDVLIETGDSGPVTPIGINVPNDQAVRETHGSKSVSLANIGEAYERSSVAGARREWCLDDAEFVRAEAYGRLAGELHTDLHEIVGHGSGRQAADRPGDPAKWLREYASTIEEARADLVALWFLADPKLAELGLRADVSALAHAGYEAYARNGAIVQLRRVKDGNRLEEDHMRNRQMIVRWILTESSALSEVVRDGKRFIVLSDVAAFREAVGRLLAEVQRVKSEGDYEGAKTPRRDMGCGIRPRVAR
jgi:dipeptidyl-peptidase-3